MNELKTKHPSASSKHKDFLLQGPMQRVNPIIYDAVTPDLIKICALNTKGAAGPSSLDGDDWRRLIGTDTFKTEGNDLRKAIAEITKIICREEFNASRLHGINVLNACRLIPLNKDPGVRPIGIGEVLRRIMGKAVMKIVKKDVQNAAGPTQLCAGQQAGCEAAVHVITDNFEQDLDCEGVLQIDASNAFNSLNRNVLLHNIKIICPEIANYVIIS